MWGWRRGIRPGAFNQRPPSPLNAPPNEYTSTPTNCQGIKVTDAESKHKLLKLLKAEQAAKMMDMDGPGATAGKALKKKRSGSSKGKSKVVVGGKGKKKAAAAAEGGEAAAAAPMES